MPVFEAMQEFTTARRENTVDELWMVEHPPVFTQGLSGKPEHVLAPGDIAVIPVDRGGQVTYHGPGQIVIYLMLDVRRASWGPRQLVTRMEQAVLDLLAGYGIAAHARPDAPGVYVGQAKIAALGLRIRRGCSYHGLSLNVAMDLEPFARINPCGYPGLKVTQLRDLGIGAPVEQVRESLLAALVATLGYTTIYRKAGLPVFTGQETIHVRA
ncbi:MAG: lipoyl(octanoyl) transferase LipB [Gammaproteobacteria bacterium]|nr:lipoyl(octanoyl) transferase LipB [Gammaproteobacteria bacterium]MCP5425108.1 lipoyl(octanoyl) transferase LipB [Gammaproteobacteria bacterium]